MEEHKCPRRDELGAANTVFKLPESDTWSSDGACSYCGSMNPDTFMQHLEDEDIELGPTDKSYKVYVEGAGKNSKFYFQHLSKPQKLRFVELLNEKKLKIGYPGHFYVNPFFMTTVPVGQKKKGEA